MRRAYYKLGFATLASLSLTVVAACASIEEQKVVEIPPPDAKVKEAFNRDYLDFLLGDFGEWNVDYQRAEDAGEHLRHVRLVIAPSFAPPLLISANWSLYDSKFPEDKPEPPEAHIYAKTFGKSEFGPEDVDYELISFSGYSVPKEFGVVGWNSRARESYATKLRLDEFELIEQTLIESGALSYSFVNGGKLSCTDGTTYFIDYDANGKSVSFARHTCDPGYQDDIAVVAPMLKIAAARLPTLADMIRDYEKHVRMDATLKSADEVRD